MKLRFGTHIAKQSKISGLTRSRNLDRAIQEDVVNRKMHACQIFTHGPRNKLANKIPYDKITEICSDEDISLVTHCSYKTNNVWKSGNVRHLEEQIASADKLDAFGIVIHIDSSSPDRIVEVLGKLKQHKTTLLFEAMDPFSAYTNPAKLNKLCQILIDKLDDKIKWGLCIDTAHIHCSGYDISSSFGMRKWLREFRYHDKIQLFHLNGAKYKKRKPSKDEHRSAFSPEDSMYHQYNIKKKVGREMKYVGRALKGSGAYVSIGFAVEHKIPVICEINDIKPKMSKSDVKKRVSYIDESLLLVKVIGLIHARVRERGAGV